MSRDPRGTWVGSTVEATKIPGGGGGGGGGGLRLIGFVCRVRDLRLGFLGLWGLQGLLRRVSGVEN